MTHGSLRRHEHQNGNFRWLPRHGVPRDIWENIPQKFLKTLAFFPFYALLITILFLIVFHFFGMVQ